MRMLILMAWLLLPLAALAYHYGPGQQDLVLDDVGRLLRSASARAEAGRPDEAIRAYEEALELMPDEMGSQRRRVRLELAKARMDNRMLPEAYLELTALVDELRDDAGADPEFTREARAALAAARYYLTWLLRLEGAPREEWEPEIEAARQTFRELAEDPDKTDAGQEKRVPEIAITGTTEVGESALASPAIALKENDSSKRYREDLEAVIRLARMDLSELQSLSLPSQCRGCCSGKGKGKGKCKKKGKGQGGERKEDARGASSGPPPDNAGS